MKWLCLTKIAKLDREHKKYSAKNRSNKDVLNKHGEFTFLFSFFLSLLDLNFSSFFKIHDIFRLFVPIA